MKRINLTLALTALLFMFAGCKKEEYAYPPVYGKIYCKTPNPKVGQPVVLTVEIKEPGNRINNAVYRWKIRGNDDFDRQSSARRESGASSIPDAPELTCTFPTNGTYNITMTASFSYTMGDVNTSMKGFASASGSVKINP